MNWVEFPALDLKPRTDPQATDTLLSQHWRDVSHKLSAQASRKFEGLLDEVLKIRPSHTPCKVCHRDDQKKLRRLSNDADSVEACSTCRRMFRLGGQLLKVGAMVRSLKRPVSEKYLGFNFTSGFVYYSLFDTVDQALKEAGSNLILLVNNWNVRQYQTHHIVPLFLGNYGLQSSIEPGTISASEMAEAAKGIQRVGYLRMDVDRLSQIFAKGLGGRQTLPRLTSLSRQMTYFFKVYLNSLAEHRQKNLPDNSHQLDRNDDRLHLLFIYAGGDDLFISGAWDEVVEFAFDVYQSFRAYTGIHPDITLSAGVYLADAKFPLYQAANSAAQLEDEAKDNDRDSLALFGQVFKWSEWLGTADETALKPADHQYLQPHPIPNLFGVLPFVLRLIPQLNAQVSKGFIQSLLLTAQIQRQMLEKAEDADLNQQRDIRYFLHLPRVAYTLAQLSNSKNDNFKDIRQSLKNPYNAPYFGAIATWIELLTRNP